jgi:hypothetical protein
MLNGGIRFFTVWRPMAEFGDGTCLLENKYAE